MEHANTAELMKKSLLMAETARRRTPNAYITRRETMMVHALIARLERLLAMTVPDVKPNARIGNTEPQVEAASLTLADNMPSCSLPVTARTAHKAE